ncbi:MAG: fibrillarin-like rRNA/tRNA 2'-O-methyltransferase [Candidatus Diapherotrites archaeon]|nr:fibrillarin-like rRNA/tRNA 2'-O-methyltransferase [Candidatus Diapherotrites archaeon]
MKRVFDGVFRDKNRLFTISFENGEYREWNPYHSKLAAAILNGLKTMPIKKGSHVLYLGAAQGNTPSFVSDIVGKQGYVICVEISEKAMEELIPLCERRENMVPVLGDANKPEGYSEYLEDIDVIYQDVAQPNQARILLKNTKYLKKGRYALLCIKARSVDVAKQPKKVFEEQIKELEKALQVMEIVNLEPFEKDHVLVVCRKL